LHQIYKRYLPISPPVERDVSPEMVRLYYDGIDQWVKKDFRTALTSLEKAKTYSPKPVYPYLNYFTALCYQSMNDFPNFYQAISQIAAQDTMVIEALEGMYYIEKEMGRPDDARKYRERITRLAPWYTVADDRDSPGK
jgi:tetratricopeptide (TPR) repeat protein